MALGSGAVGVFTNSTAAWRHLQAAGSNTGDRVWRMPVWKHYTKSMTGENRFSLSQTSVHCLSPFSGIWAALHFSLIGRNYLGTHIFI